MRLSRAGNPLCSQCTRLAATLGNYHLSNGYLSSLAYCQRHAPQDALPLHVGLELEPILDTMLYWRIPITLEEVERRYNMPAGPAQPWPVTREEMQDALAKINPGRFVTCTSLQNRRRGEDLERASEESEA
jgi:hypothetical protein